MFCLTLLVSPQVNREIVSGLKYVQQTYRKGMRSKWALSTNKSNLLIWPVVMSRMMSRMTQSYIIKCWCVGITTEIVFLTAHTGSMLTIKQRTHNEMRQIYIILFPSFRPLWACAGQNVSTNRESLCSISTAGTQERSTFQAHSLETPGCDVVLILTQLLTNLWLVS